MTDQVKGKATQDGDGESEAICLGQMVFHGQRASEHS